jgi:hypothetical protein
LGVWLAAGTFSVKIRIGRLAPAGRQAGNPARLAAIPLRESQRERLMADLRQRLLSIRNEAAEYFVHVGESYKSEGYYFNDQLVSEWNPKVRWASLTAEDQSRGEAIGWKLGEVLGPFHHSSTLGERSLTDLQQAVRQMQAAFRFELWEDSAQIWLAVSASDAKLIFETALGRISGLLSFGLSPVVENDELDVPNADGELFTAEPKNQRADDSGATPNTSALETADLPAAERTAENRLSAGSTPDGVTPSGQGIGGRKTERRKLRDDYVGECKRAGVRVTDEMIATAANPPKDKSKGWNTRDPIQKWLQCDPKYEGRPDRMIRAVFEKKPHLPKPSPTPSHR